MISDRRQRSWPPLVALALALFASLSCCSAATRFEKATRDWQHKYKRIADLAYKQRDFATTMRISRKFAKEGVADAQDVYGSMFYNAEGDIPQDYNEAIKWYRLAAIQSDVWAQDSLGAMYLKGEGVPKNYTLADYWLSLAAGDSKAAIPGPALWTLSQVVARDRDILEKKMSPAQIHQARALAEHGRMSRYADCY